MSVIVGEYHNYIYNIFDWVPLNWGKSYIATSKNLKDWGIQLGSGSRQLRDLPVDGKKLVIGETHQQEKKFEWAQKFFK